ncbi:hypothetical protein MCOR21_011566 [Pyricularia oryzae]|nr:hypothetical protein MCOR19_009578 [Pyricularia oryzae]KAI6414705.1 hypothetical protein MCOR21_011566 [Pyricularia oryzae]KAI6470678.1 hypothetical protein MCOR18_008969 [Pyricularia oryzae]KAI6554970.1 hypothetical protein MCOR09_010158 [Pyricularia oryzae]
MMAELLFNPGTWTALAVLAAAYYHFFLRSPALPFPPANKSASELQDASSLITNSLSKSNGGPVVVTLASGGRKILLPSSLAAWVKTNRDLDHQQLVREDFMSGIPGFEGSTLLHQSGSPIMDIIKTRMGLNDGTLRTLNASVKRTLHDTLGEGAEWHAIDWYAGTSNIIARAASSVFVGPEKADDPEWLELAQTYVTAYFTGVAELGTYPAWARSIVHWFLPNVKTCRKLLPRARHHRAGRSGARKGGGRGEARGQTGARVQRCVGVGARGVGRGGRSRRGAALPGHGCLFHNGRAAPRAAHRGCAPSGIC